MNNTTLPKEQIVVILDLAHRTGLSKEHVSQMLVEIGMLTMIMSKKDQDTFTSFLAQIKSKQIETPELDSIADILSKLYDKTSRKI